MPDPYQWTVVRVVPRPELGECFNAGVVLWCRTRRFLRAATHLDERKLEAIAPGADPAPLRALLDAYERLAAGDPAAGAVAALEPSERFSWLAAPASTVLQCSPVHTGITADPEAELHALTRRYVNPPPA